MRGDSETAVKIVEARLWSADVRARGGGDSLCGISAHATGKESDWRGLLAFARCRYKELSWIPGSPIL